MTIHCDSHDFLFKSGRPLKLTWGLSHVGKKYIITKQWAKTCFCLSFFILIYELAIRDNGELFIYREITHQSTCICDFKEENSVSWIPLTAYNFNITMIWPYVLQGNQYSDWSSLKWHNTVDRCLISIGTSREVTSSHPVSS